MRASPPGGITSPRGALEQRLEHAQQVLGLLLDLEVAVAG